MSELNEIRKELEAALADEEFALAYQPQVTAKADRVAAVEALIRWRRTNGEWVSPATFIPLAERVGLIDEIGAWTMKRACSDARQWTNVTVSVNVSPVQFRNPSIVKQIVDCVESAGLALTQIELEVTEGAVIEDPERAERLICELRESGVRMALDDFGTGYSSLSYLRRLSWDKVKIDKSFVDDVASLKSAAIVHATVALARAIGLKVTAEGVETAEQHKFLKLAGCHYLQGYYFARPMWADALTEFLIEWGNMLRARAS